VEAEVLANLRGYGPHAGRPTIVLTASRRSAIESAQLVVYLERGTVAGAGTHQQLLAAHAGYRELVGAYDAVLDEAVLDEAVLDAEAVS
jgi:ABC-type transport system involved in Fe-S cluster assembly fused permease/ATPase subunit